jgi:hypothetical protein
MVKPQKPQKPQSQAGKQNKTKKKIALPQKSLDFNP